MATSSNSRRLVSLLLGILFTFLCILFFVGEGREKDMSTRPLFRVADGSKIYSKRTKPRQSVSMNRQTVTGTHVGKLSDSPSGGFVWPTQRSVANTQRSTETNFRSSTEKQDRKVEQLGSGASRKINGRFSSMRDTIGKKTRYYIPMTDEDFNQIPLLETPKDGRVECPKDLDNKMARKLLECRHRLPNVIGLGVAKCGTASISFFLSAHPHVVHSNPFEVYFWTRHTYRGLGWYMHRMPVSSKYQLTMEKTPNYFYSKGVPENIDRVMPPNTKFIVAVRDPVKRAVSHYVQQMTKQPRPEIFIDKPVDERRTTRCFLNDTFETSVIRPDGSLMDYNCLVAGGIYYRGLKKWFDFFPRERIFVIDGDEFVKNPLPILQELETFLGLPKYFDESKIYFDQSKGYYCRSGYKPKGSCLGSGKGRSHPDVDPAVLQRLKEFYHPHNLQFEKLLRRKFSWT